MPTKKRRYTTRRKGTIRKRKVKRKVNRTRKRRRRKFSMANIPQFVYDKHRNLKRVKSDAGMTKAIATCKGKCLFLFYMQGCPYCRNLRQVVGDLCKSGSKVIVFERSDMGSKYKSYTSEGFPSIYKVKNRQLVKFSGNRELSEFKKFLN